MTVGEMHLAIQQGVDKINSFQADLLLPQEIDLELNQAQYKFINTKYGQSNRLQKGFEEGQKRIDDIRTLIEELPLGTTFKEQLDTNIWVDTAVLPADYMYLVNVRAHSLKNERCIPLDEDIDYTSAGGTWEYFEVPQDNLIGASLKDSVHGIYIVDNVDNHMWSTYPPALNPNNVTLWTQATHSPLDGTQSGIDAFNAEMIAGTAGTWKGRWQDMFGVHRPGSWIIQMLAGNPAAAWLNCDPSDTTGALPVVGEVSHLVALDSLGNELYRTRLRCITQEKPIRHLNGVAGIHEVKKVCKYIQHDDIFTMLSDPFNTTTWEKPLYTIRNDELDLYTNDIFIIPEVKLTYIRKPAEISLSLQVSCELPEHSHREIVDMAVSSILESISDPRYKTHEIEVNKNE